MFTASLMLSTLATSGTQAQNTPASQELVTVLETIQQEKNIAVLYEPQFVEDVIVAADINLGDDPSAILEVILADSDLEYTAIDHKNFIIRPSTKPATITRISQPDVTVQEPPEADRNIRGVVTDFNTGDPLVGATVRVKGIQGLGTATDPNGYYELTLPDDRDTLIFSYTGYETLEVLIGAREIVNVRLRESISMLDEVVVTAVGIEANKRGLGYSVNDLAGSEIRNTNEANIISALSAKTPGVVITSSSGSPGASANIRIRGNKSINGSNKPLFILDGIPIDNTSSGNGIVGVDVSNRAIDINPNDIQNISILKGPAATALYGIRAANGAVVITTKRGKEGKPRITFKNSFGLSEVNQVPERQTIYAQGTFTGGETVYRGPETGEANSYGPLLSTLEFDGDPTYRYDRHGRLVPAGQGNGMPAISYDPYDAFFVTGRTIDNNLSISGGSERIAYYVSLGNYFQQGVVPKSNWIRTSIKGNFDITLSDRLRSTIGTTVVRSGGERMTRGNALSGIGIGLYRNPNTFDIGNGKKGRAAADDPSSYIFPDGEQRAYRGSNRYDNPFWSVNRVPFEDEVNRVIQSVSLSYDILPWLTATYRFGVDHYSDKRESAFDINSGSENNGRIDLDNRLSTDYNSDFLLLVQRSLTDDLKLDATLGHNFFNSEFNTRSIEGVNLSKQGFFHISNASEITTNESIARRKLHGIYGDVRLNWRNTIYLNLTGRNDWSSTLPKQNNSFFYPTASLGIEFTELLGMTDHSILSYGKLRASYGEVGNDPGIFLTANYFQQANADGDNLLPGNEFPAFGVNAFERSGTLGNGNLKAESTATIEIGTDLKLFLGRIDLDVTYYKATTTDLIVQAAISAASGFVTAPVNAGKIENEGIEIALGISPVRRPNFTWDIEANFTTSDNVVAELPEGIDQLSIAEFSALSSLIVEGEPYGVLVGTAYLRNEQGQLIIGADGWPLINPEQIKVGDPNPDWTAGLRNTLTSGPWRLSALLDVRSGGDIWNGTKGVMDNLGVGAESGRDREVTGYVYEGVTESGEPNTVPVDFANPANGTSGIKWRRNGFLGLAEDNIQDGGWVRLREVALSYTIPQHIFANSFVQAMSFTLSGRNLWLHTDYTGVDPETNLRGDSNATGWDYFNLPNTRSYTLTVNMDF